MENTANLMLARAYLEAWSQKDLKKIEGLISNEIHFKGAMTETFNKTEFLESVKQTLPMLQEIKIRAEFSYKEQVMFAYDFVCVPPIGISRVAELMTFENGKIRKLELFFDARPFEKLLQGQS